MTRDRVLVTERRYREGGETVYHRAADADRTVCGLPVSEHLLVPVADLEDPRKCDHCRDGGVADATDSDNLAGLLTELDPDEVGPEARPDGGFCGPGDDPAVLEGDDSGVAPQGSTDEVADRLRDDDPYQMLARAHGLLQKVRLYHGDELDDEVATFLQMAEHHSERARDGRLRSHLYEDTDGGDEEHRDARDE